MHSRVYLGVDAKQRSLLALEELLQYCGISLPVSAAIAAALPSFVQEVASLALTDLSAGTVALCSALLSSADADDSGSGSALLPPAVAPVVSTAVLLSTLRLLLKRFPVATVGHVVATAQVCLTQVRHRSVLLMQRAPSPCTSVPCASRPLFPLMHRVSHCLGPSPFWPRLRTASPAPFPAAAPHPLATRTRALAICWSLCCPCVRPPPLTSRAADAVDVGGERADARPGPRRTPSDRVCPLPRRRQ